MSLLSGYSTLYHVESGSINVYCCSESQYKRNLKISHTFLDIFFSPIKYVKVEHAGACSITV